MCVHLFGTLLVFYCVSGPKFMWSAVDGYLHGFQFCWLQILFYEHAKIYFWWLYIHVSVGNIHRNGIRFWVLKWQYDQSIWIVVMCLRVREKWDIQQYVGSWVGNVGGCAHQHKKHQSIKTELNYVTPSSMKRGRNHTPNLKGWTCGYWLEEYPQYWRILRHICECDSCWNIHKQGITREKQSNLTGPKQNSLVSSRRCMNCGTENTLLTKSCFTFWIHRKTIRISQPPLTAIWGRKTRLWLMGCTHRMHITY